jgi:membrane protein insertase Oxa1/YidC/SpoIIIJ
MSYNWEEIFKDKSNQELYEIYSGESNLPDLTIPFAKNELENRNFDFENMEANRDAWKLSNLIQEDDIYESEVMMRKLTYASLNFYLLVIFVIIIFFLFVIPNELLYGLPITISVSTVLILLNNYIYKIQQKNISKLRNEKRELIAKLEKENLLENQSLIFYELTKERGKNQKSIRILLLALVITAVIFLILSVLKNILK